ncbi:hypothetical protein MTO98_31405 [Mucilaginibacter sp. SMC90]|uniref:transglutaminase domain-containing protein n=1 Tax=Mucilaginibacter sp. SMC90 TaxID=2929803 RepID=UPI001FB3198D|nr:hypothetical protein [Mucilaginibacter sp. SMC90]UOE48911.1 hypothetical protein MTO98_31405 [Mucilaginibacter sp. SMC90]
MKVKLIIIACILFIVAVQVKAQSYRDFAHVKELSKSAPYDNTERQTFPDFTYQSLSNPQLSALRQTFNLDSVAGKGSQTDRAIRLLNWFHNQVPHQDTLNIDSLNAMSVISFYRSHKVGQGCYVLSIGMNDVFLAMGFKSRSVICFSDAYPVAHGGHVVNALYIDSLDKWIYIDPQENAYMKDEKGVFLSIEEVRQRIIDGRPIILNSTANYHNVPTKKQDYVYTFLAEHLYRMICPVVSEYNSQTITPGKVFTYVELLPAGSKDPRADRFETSTGKKYNVITYHTNNSSLFWKKP